MTTKISQVPVNNLPSGTIPLENQVAGHTFQEGTDAIGMLKDESDDIVLKPLTKPICGEREKSFYELLQTTKNPCLLALKRLVPEYRGVVTADVNGKEVEFIKLVDLTHGMRKPCIMDIKVGKRTWDPLATKEKILVEEEKYAACKKTIGLCIPGFQVYDIETGKLHRFSKDYGKKLNETTFRDTLRLFLNAKSGLCRKLVIQILLELKSIQKWIRMQAYYKLYSSSILLVYDAEKLETILHDNKLNCNIGNGSILSHADIPSDLNTSTMPQDLPYENTKSWCDENTKDYEQTLLHPKSDSCANKLIVNGCTVDRSWTHVKMIDFAHAFSSDDDSLDTNYMFGIDSLVRIFEGFLKECG